MVKLAVEIRVGERRVDEFTYRFLEAYRRAVKGATDSRFFAILDGKWDQLEDTRKAIEEAFGTIGVMALSEIKEDLGVSIPDLVIMPVFGKQTISGEVGLVAFRMSNPSTFKVLAKRTLSDLHTFGPDDWKELYEEVKYNLQELVYDQVLRAARKIETRK